MSRANDEERVRRGLVEFLRDETTSGKLLIAATVVAVVWANVSPTYQQFWDHLAGFGPSALHLDAVTVQLWVADGALTIFFLVAGLEIKRELVAGELSSPRRAALPAISALAGAVVPVAIFLLVARGAPGASRAWAVPTATDIAFALGVLAIAGSRTPRSLRVILLSLAVVDDLIAITIIAFVYTAHLDLRWLAASVVPFALVAWLQHARVRAWPLYTVLGVVAWECVHASGIHATIAGVVLGLLVRARTDEGEDESPADRWIHTLHVPSGAVIVPLFALSSAGVPLSGPALYAAVHSPIAQGITAGLVIGKPIGVLAGAWLAVRAGIAHLPADLHWADIRAVAVLAGCGFTVSLLICDLAFPPGETLDAAKTAVLAASVVSSVAGAVLLARRGRAHGRLADSWDDDLAEDLAG